MVTSAIGEDHAAKLAAQPSVASDDHRPGFSSSHPLSRPRWQALRETPCLPLVRDLDSCEDAVGGARR